MKQIKILSIGNSFAEDAHTYLGKIARSAGMEVKAITLYIGGCSIAMHWENAQADAKAYDYLVEGGNVGRKCSIKEALCEDAWDIVTVQQASYASGMAQTYADGPKLLAYVKEYCPNAKIWFHKTWSYENVSTHDGFANYGNSQAQMDQCITAAVDRFCRENGGLPQIPVGDVIKALRVQAQFDTEAGGQSLYRDGFHMHLIYGRYAAAAAWFQTLLGELRDSSFIPGYGDLQGGYAQQLPADFETDPLLIETIRETVRTICRA